MRFILVEAYLFFLLIFAVLYPVQAQQDHAYVRKATGPLRRFLLTSDNYVFSCHDRQNHRIYWRCLESTREHCQARCIMSHDVIVSVKGLHTHLPNYNPNTMVFLQPGEWKQ